MAIITLANGKKFEAGPEKTLLDSARHQGITLEYSCRTGRCGTCRAKAGNSNTELRQSESALSREEIESGYILTCCRAATDDVYLDIEDIGEIGNIQVKTLPCRISALSKLASDVISVTLRTPVNSQLEYQPGQYIDVIGKAGIRRSYSIANAPREDGLIELQIRSVEGGVMSAYWFEQAKINDLLRLEGPLGTFSLRERPIDHLIFLATGTGIAPVKAMLENLKDKPHLFSGAQVHVYWGGRVPEDFYWVPSTSLPEFNFIPVLSRTDTEWTGRNGYVQSALLEDGLELANSQVYACGSEEMIQSAKIVLVEAGLEARNFYSDAFVSSS